jgi:hypothetical protein
MSCHWSGRCRRSSVIASHRASWHLPNLDDREDGRRCWINAPVVLNLLLFTIALALNLALPVDYQRATYFIDSQDYLRQSRAPLLSKDFLVPAPGPPHFYPRSAMVPLIYKIGNGDPATIIVLQKILHSLATLALASALLAVTQTTPARLFLLPLIYLLMAWWPVFGWTIMVLSEALSFAFLLCWISSTLFFYFKASVLSLVAQILTITILGFTRDTWPYLLVAFYAMATVMSSVLRRKYLRMHLALLGIALLVFLLQHTSATIGQRSRLPLLNSIVMRILPDPEWVRWFAQHGMPQVDELTSYFCGKEALDRRIPALYQLYTDQSFKPLFTWLNNNGQLAYTKFMLSHPSYTLLLREGRGVGGIVAANVFLYLGSAQGYSRAAAYVFPFTTLRRDIIIMIAVLVAFARTRQPTLLMVLALAGFIVLQALFVYNADGLEVDRHLIVTRPLIELTAIIAIGLILDVIIARSMPSYSRRAATS